MTNEEAREVLGDVSAYLASRASLENEMLAGHTFTDICNAIKTLKQQPCEDCISRSEALRIAESYYHAEQVAEEIRELPSVTPTIPKGEWKALNYKDEMWGYVYKCSNCGAIEYGDAYCPNCGAKMEGVREEEK